jgi:isocitrate dehydrogenase (NAD+)
VRLREEFGLSANLRPVKTMGPGGRYEDIDLVLIRENIEGLYVAFEHFIPVGESRDRAVSAGRPRDCRGV